MCWGCLGLPGAASGCLQCVLPRELWSETPSMACGHAPGQTLPSRACGGGSQRYGNRVSLVEGEGCLRGIAVGHRQPESRGCGSFVVRALLRGAHRGVDAWVRSVCYAMAKLSTRPQSASVLNFFFLPFKALLQTGDVFHLCAWPGSEIFFL